MSRFEEYEAQFVWTAGKRKYQPDIYQPGDRDPAAPSDSELRAEEAGRRA